MLLQMALFHSFLQLSSIPLCVCVVSVCVYTNHTFFIHSSVDEHLGCFHILSIVNRAAVSTGVNVYFQIRIFVFSFMPRSGNAGSYGSWTPILFSIVTAPVYILINSVWRFPFLYTLSSIYYF